MGDGAAAELHHDHGAARLIQDSRGGPQGALRSPDSSPAPVSPETPDARPVAVPDPCERPCMDAWDHRVSKGGSVRRAAHGSLLGHIVRARSG
ncbi:Hypothetical protein A7982_05941 [Minicystis rosea]|nr:Hypothetical protein A7982_05941 [Minicystis rosea]